ncbi:baseplate J/gp47 family protein [Kiloniella sp. b19]|uniref:baseplate J/gp47 family protein n=1 Tax=Kiloniella sp. GXU_MW_B19 TaxID=3141326 RepID=UPI0031D0F3A7
MTNNRFTPINLRQFSLPDLLENTDVEVILAELKTFLISSIPAEERAAVAATLELESDPATKLLEAFAYRESLLKQVFNDGARAVMLAYSGKADLEHLAAFYNVVRQTIEEGDPNAIPPVPPVMEDDDSLRFRTQLAPEAFSTAGSRGAYKFHGLSANSQATKVEVESPEPGLVRISYRFDPESIAAAIKDVNPHRTAPGTVTVPVLARYPQGGNEKGVPTTATLKAVEDTLSDDLRRPLTDNVIVTAANILEYSITAKLYLFDGFDPQLAEKAALAQAQAYTNDRHRIGSQATESGVHAALQVEGVSRVELQGWADVVASDLEAPWCESITLTTEVLN